MQRVAIGAALAAEPDVLILDEPTAALDPEGKQEVFDVLERIRQTRSMTVIMAEQDTEHIAYWADQVLFMVNGELVRNGDASLFVREKGLLESSGVQVADDPLPQVKAVQQGKKHKKDKKNQPERSKDVVISLDHVSYQYERGGNASKALDDVTFDIERGSFIGLIGRNGSGKTTLAKHLNGLIRPTQGTVTVDGMDLGSMSDASLTVYRRDRVGFIFQMFNLVGTLNVEENILLPSLAGGRRVAPAALDAMIEKVGLSHRRHAMPDTLSGGEQQRVAIARALAVKPRVLLLDEPLGALDLKLRKDMQSELKAIQQRLGITFIYVTHDQEEALSMSDTIVVMDGGVIQQIGSPTDIYNEPQNAFVADFIGESNIVDGVMLSDYNVEFQGMRCRCVDKGFGLNEPVDVVVRPEDIDMVPPGEGMLSGDVTSVTFKGVHYEIIVDIKGFKWMIQTTEKAEVGDRIGISIKPDEIQIMKKSEYSGLYGDYSSFSEEFDELSDPNAELTDEDEVSEIGE